MAKSKIVCKLKLKRWAKPVLCLSVLLFGYAPKWCFTYKISAE